MSGNLKKLLKDDRIPAIAAIVKAPDDGGDHWSHVGKDGARQLLIRVIGKTSHTPIWAHACGGYRGGRGIWQIPDIGTEVLVSFDNGDLEGDAFIVAEFGRANVDITADTLLLLDQLIEARSVGGTANSVATKADLQTLKDAITNAIVVGLDGGASLKATILTALATWPIGTTVFKAE
jgi:hypothetical protein